MFRWLDGLFIALQNKTNAFLTEMKEDETGIDGFVAAVILVLIVVLLAALFYTYLGDWFADIWSRITGATDTIQ